MKSVCGLGEVAPLLLRGADAPAEDAAAGHAEDAVAALPAGALEVAERVDEVGQPRTAARCWSWPGTARPR